MDILSNSFKYMRVLLLFICSYFIYYNFVEHFNIAKDLDGVFDWFNKLTFIKCAAVFFIVYILLDALTKYFIIFIFYILTIPLFKKANKQNKIYLSMKKDLTSAIHTKKSYLGVKVSSVLNRNVSLGSYKKINVNGFDNFSLIMIQLCYVNYFTNYNYKTLYISALLCLLFVNILKSYLLYGEKAFKNIII